MKRFTAILLAVILLAGMILMMGGMIAYALAEAAEPAPGVPLVNLTGVIVAALALVFDFLLAWIAKVMIPPIKAWMKQNMTERQHGMAWDLICKLVDAAEQIITGPGMGTSRMDYVKQALLDRGVEVDTDLIEAAVKRMNERMMHTLEEGLGVNPAQSTDDEEIDDEYSLPPLEEWPLEMIVDFCKGNGIACTGCQTKKEYIQAIIGAAKQTLDEPLPVHDSSTGATTLEAARAMLGLEPDAPAGKDYTELDVGEAINPYAEGDAP